MRQLALIPPPLPAELQERIADARRSGRLSDCAADVLDLLADHPSGPRAGRDRALSIAAMQEMWTRRGVHVWSERAIKDSAKFLLEEMEIAIGSSRERGRGGFYLCVSDADAESAVRPYRSEIYSLFRRIRCLSPNSAFVRRLNGQLELGKGEEA